MNITLKKFAFFLLKLVFTSFGQFAIYCFSQHFNELLMNSCRRKNAEFTLHKIKGLLINFSTILLRKKRNLTFTSVQLKFFVLTLQKCSLKRKDSWKSIFWMNLTDNLRAKLNMERFYLLRLEMSVSNRRRAFSKISKE